MLSRIFEGRLMLLRRQRFPDASKSAILLPTCPSKPAGQKALIRIEARMRFALLVVFCAFLPAFCLAQTTSSNQSSIGFSIDHLDKTADPCVDFYQYACGNWLKTQEIPADQTEWASFVELYERNLVTEREILEKA